MYYYIINSRIAATITSLSCSVTTRGMSFIDCWINSTFADNSSIDPVRFCDFAEEKLYNGRQINASSYRVRSVSMRSVSLFNAAWPKAVKGFLFVLKQSFYYYKNRINLELFLGHETQMILLVLW